MTNVLVSPHAANEELGPALEELGARVWTWPPLAIGPPADDSALRDAIDNLFGYDWLILKNPYAVENLMRGFLKEHTRDELDDLRVLVIGSDGCEKANEFQIHVDIALERFANHHVHDEIRSYVGEGDLPRLNVLIPNAGVSRDSFAEQLANAGARVDSVPAYRTCSNTNQLTKLKTLIAGGGIDCVVFTDDAAVDEFARVFDTDDLPVLLSGVTVICGDQSTAHAAGAFGLAQLLVAAEPSVHEFSALIQSV